MQRNTKIALFAIIPAIAFGGFFMAEMFTQSEPTIPSVDAMIVTEIDNGDGSATFEGTLAEAIALVDEVTITSP